MNYSVTKNAIYYTSISDISEEIWSALDCERNLYYNRNFLESIEENHPEITFFYIVLVDDNKKPKAPKPKKKNTGQITLRATLDKLKKKDKAPISKRKAGGQENFGMLSVKAGIDNNPNATQADRIAGATKNLRGGGIAIQGLGFRGVK